LRACATLIFIVCSFVLFFCYNVTPPSEISTLSLHDALPISPSFSSTTSAGSWERWAVDASRETPSSRQSGSSRRVNPRCVSTSRSEEHTSELQSLAYLVCRLLLEKKKKKISKN